MLSENLQLVEAESDDLLGINVVKQIYLSACIFFLVITSFLHKQAVANDYETFSGKESLCCSVEEKAELNFTLYLRMDALFKNELFIDPGQEDFIDYIDISLGIDVYYDRFSSLKQTIRLTAVIEAHQSVTDWLMMSTIR